MATQDVQKKIDELESQQKELEDHRRTLQKGFDDPLKKERSRLDEALREPLAVLSHIAQK